MPEFQASNTTSPARTTGPSDFPRSCITGLRPRPFPHDPPSHHHRRVIMGPPGSRARRFRTCTGSSTPRGPPTARENAADGVAFRTVRQRRHPKQGDFEAQQPSLHVPLPTLRRRPRGRPRTARGHRESLAIRCWTLSFLSPDRFIPAPSHGPSDTPQRPGQVGRGCPAFCVGGLMVSVTVTPVAVTV